MTRIFKNPRASLKRLFPRWEETVWEGAYLDSGRQTSRIGFTRFRSVCGVEARGEIGRTSGRDCETIGSV